MKLIIHSALNSFVFVIFVILLYISKRYFIWNFTFVENFLTMCLSHHPHFHAKMKTLFQHINYILSFDLGQVLI